MILENTLDCEKVAFIGAVWETSYLQNIPKKIRDVILRYSDSKDDVTKMNAIRLLIDRFNKNATVQRKLIRLANTDKDTKAHIAKTSAIIHKDNPSFCLQLLQHCAKTDDQNLILNAISMNIGLIAKDYPIECLTIIKSWATKSNSPILGQFTEWSAEQIGGSNKIDKIEIFLLRWIKTEKARVVLEFTFPKILCEIYKGKNDKLLSLIKKINLKGKNKSILITKTLERIFSSSQIKEKSFVRTCNKILLEIADLQNINTSIDERLVDPRMQVLALVENINLRKKKIDPQKVKKNLKEFPNIVSFFGEGKIYGLMNTAPDHPLIIFLNRSKVAKKTVKKYENSIERQTDNFRRTNMFT